MNVAFISWDGPDQNYMESLFLPIFGAASDRDLRFSVLQFTWGPQEIQDSIEAAASRLGIHYESRTVLRRPLQAATAAMIFRGAASIIRHARRHNTQVLMPRAIIPAAMCLLAMPLLPGVRLFFDTDGFMADERVDFQGWDPEGPVYKLFRRIEAAASRKADAVMARTHRGKAILLERAGPGVDPEQFFVIPNAKDPDHFSPGSPEDRATTRQREGIAPDAPWLVYAGSLGPQYFPDSIFTFYEALLARRLDSRLTILTGHEDIARSILEARGLDPELITIKRVHPDQVPPILAAADLGIAFRAPTFSQQGVCPIKVAEYLLCGLPVIATYGVGDIDEVLAPSKDTEQNAPSVGILLSDTELDGAGFSQAVDQFLGDILPRRDFYRENCRQRGLSHFGLKEIGDQLQAALLSLH